MEFTSGMKVVVTATNEQLATMQMTNDKVNRRLRKYESTISDILAKGGFEDEEGKIHKSCVLDSTFVIPACWLKLADEKDEEKRIEENPEPEEVIVEEKDDSTSSPTETEPETNEEDAPAESEDND